MRIPIPKGIRFKILMRDGFRCQYCGRTPPTVILQVDHVLAVVLGGINSEDNLVTSCSDCNLGKSSKPVDRLPAPSAAGVSSRIAELEAYKSGLIEKSRAKAELVDCITGFWIKQARLKSRFELAYGFKNSVSRFLDNLSPQEVIGSMVIALERKLDRDGVYGDHQAFKYFCGVCWYKIRGQHPMDAYKKEPHVRETV